MHRYSCPHPIRPTMGEISPFALRRTSSQRATRSDSPERRPLQNFRPANIGSQRLDATSSPLIQEQVEPASRDAKTAFSFDASGCLSPLKHEQRRSGCAPIGVARMRQTVYPFPTVRCEVGHATRGLPEKRGKMRALPPSWPVGTGAEITRRQRSTGDSAVRPLRHAHQHPIPNHTHFHPSLWAARTTPYS